VADGRFQRRQGRPPALPGGGRELRFLGVPREPLLQRQDESRRLVRHLREAPGHRVRAEVPVEVVQALLDGLEIALAMAYSNVPRVSGCTSNPLRAR